PSHPVPMMGSGRGSGGTGTSVPCGAMMRMEHGYRVSPPLWSYPTSNYINPNILNLGGQQSGVYTPGIEVNIGRVDTCPVYVTTVGTGVPVNQSILADADILAVPDILGAASAAYVNVYPEINVAGSNHIYAGWQKFAPGMFTGQYYQVRWQLQTSDPNTIAYLL